MTEPLCLNLYLFNSKRSHVFIALGPDLLLGVGLSPRTAASQSRLHSSSDRTASPPLGGAGLGAGLNLPIASYEGERVLTPPQTHTWGYGRVHLSRRTWPTFLVPLQAPEQRAMPRDPSQLLS